MIVRRFPLMMGVALVFGATAAHAQSAPAVAPASAPIPATRIEDIEVAQDGDTISILVKFSGQPSAASATAEGKDLKLVIDGVALNALTLAPPTGSLVTRVVAGKGQITLSGAALATPDVVIYRHAILVKAKLAEPADIGGASLMTGAATTGPSPDAAPITIAHAPIPSAAPRPVAATPAPTPLPAPAPTAAPILVPAPQSPPEHTQAKPSPDDELLSSPTPAPTITAGPIPPAHTLATASIAGIDAARCVAAVDELAKDSWALAAMGDLALCLLDEGKTDEARARLDQLGAITPQDWRVSLGRAVLASQTGDVTTANDLFLAASLGAPDDAARTAIVARITHHTSAVPASVTAPDVGAPAPQSQPAADLDLQLPLPK